MGCGSSNSAQVESKNSESSSAPATAAKPVSASITEPVSEPVLAPAPEVSPASNLPSNPSPPESREAEIVVNPAPAEINYKPIHSAIRWNKPVSEVEALLVSPEAVNCVDKDNGNYPIHIAAQNGHEDLIALLIKKNVIVDAKNMKGNTGLHMAIGYDYYNVAKRLIDAGADLNAVNDSGFPAKYGLEGDKCLGIAALVNATNEDEISAALDMCEGEIENLNKINFAQAGLKTKKAVGAIWSPALQNRFKDITSRIP